MVVTGNEIRLNVKRLYKGANGFIVTGNGPGGGALRHSKALVYGELTHRGVGQLIQALQLEEEDVFYDLGSGLGKVVLEVAMTVPVRKSIGVEIAQGRHQVAASVLRRARRQDLIIAHACTFRNQSLLDVSLRDATAVYCASTCFSYNTMNRLARKLADLNREIRLACLTTIFRKPREMQLEKTVYLNTTWNPRQQTYIYRLAASH
jgi:hypothetical protein